MSEHIPSTSHEQILIDSAITTPLHEGGPEFEESAPHYPQSTSSESQRWEDVPSSMNSSLPSMSYPERTNPHTPEPKLPTTSEPSKPAPEQSFSSTKAIFDPTLSTQVRLSALAASLAINLLLPFVNGVMLGFGEVFAKNVLVRWIGWERMAGPWSAKKKGTSSVGVGVPLPNERKASARQL